MSIKPYLIFRLHQTRYAIAAESVSEIFLLPELTPIAEAPPDIVGLLNLHAQFIPVMHLDLRFGHKFDQCNLTDSVIVVESQSMQVGVIVHQVEAVNEIDDRYIQEDLSCGREQNINQAFIQGIINLDDEMIILLNIDNLVRHPDALEQIVEEVEPQQTQDFYEQFFNDANLTAKEILQQRAINLKELSDQFVTSELTSIAIVSIADKYYGLDLAIVREFTSIARVTSIPCCPEHIIGNMNLRGEILTLVNICQSLQIPSFHHLPTAKAVVIEFDQIVAGIVVDEVYDVVDFLPEELKSVPVAIDNSTASYLKAVANYQNQTLYVIDLPKLIAQGSMTVELTA